MRALAGFTLVLALALAPAQEALAFECSHSRDFCFVSLWWPTRRIPISVEVPEGARITKEEMIGAVDAAVARWNSVGCSDIRLVRTDAPAANVIRLVIEDWDPKLPGAVGTTTVSHEVRSGEIRYGIVSINQDLVGITSETSCPGFYDLETVLTHELGHFLGIAHPCETESTYPDGALCPPKRCEELELEREPDQRMETMWPEVSSCDRQLATLEADDVAALCTIYPVAGPAMQCYPLPNTSQQQPLVANQSFGCSAGGGTPALWALVLLPFLRKKRQRRQHAAGRT